MGSLSKHFFIPGLENHGLISETAFALASSKCHLAEYSKDPDCGHRAGPRRQQVMVKQSEAATSPEHEGTEREREREWI
jgi:hypothetical protein